MLFTIIVGFGIQRISPTILWYPIRSINSPYFRFCSIVKRNFSVLLRISSISPIGIRSAADRLRFTIYPTRLALQPEGDVVLAPHILSEVAKHIELKNLPVEGQAGFSANNLFVPFKIRVLSCNSIIA